MSASEVGDEDPGLARLELERTKAASVESERTVAPGRLTPRQRVEALFEAGGWLELGALAASQQPGVQAPTPGDGVLTGFGVIAGRQAAVISEDPLILSRTDGQVAKAKRRRLLKLALQQQLPVVFFADGAGRPSPVFAPSGGELFGGLAQQTDDADMRRRQAALIGVILGPATGQAGELLAECDLVVQVDRPRSAGTGNLKADVVVADDAGAAGGAGAGRLKADVVVADDDGAARVAATLVGLGGSRAPAAAPEAPAPLVGVPAMDALAGQLADPGTFLPFVRDPGSGLVSGIGHLGGLPTVIAVTGAGGQRLLVPDDIERLRRAAAVSARFSIPLLLVQDCDGYSPEIMGDRRRLRSVADLVAELRSLPAPMVVLVAGAGHVLGTYCLGGRQVEPGCILAWPWARIGVTDTAAYEAETLAPHRQPGPWLAAGMGLVDDVVTPAETGPWLRWLVRLCHERGHLPPIPYEDRWYGRSSIKGT